jgi:membrane protein YdbS with pleckstrin-like domain
VDKTPLCAIKPAVVPVQYFVWGPLFSGGIALFFGGVIYLFTFLNLAFGLGAFCIVFTVCMVLLGLQVFNEPGRTTYTIFPDRMEYDTGLFVSQRRTLPFDQVTDVELTVGMLQHTAGVGTVTLVTKNPAEGTNTYLWVPLSNVPRPQEVYELLRSVALKDSAKEPEANADPAGESPPSGFVAPQPEP